MTKSNFAKTKAQIKSSRYYLFWGAATVAVMAGQIYVGNGYRQMSQKVGDLTQMLQFRFEMDLLENRRKYSNGILRLDDLDPDDYVIWEEIK